MLSHRKPCPAPGLAATTVPYNVGTSLAASDARQECEAKDAKVPAMRHLPTSKNKVLWVRSATLRTTAHRREGPSSSTPLAVQMLWSYGSFFCMEKVAS